MHDRAQLISLRDVTSVIRGLFAFSVLGTVLHTKGISRLKIRPSDVKIMVTRPFCFGYLKMLINAVLGQLQAFCMYGGMGMSAPSLYKESTDSLIIEEANFGHCV